MAVIISVDISLMHNVTATCLGNNLASYQILLSVVMKCDSFPLEPETQRQFLICPHFVSTKTKVRPDILKFSAIMGTYLPHISFRCTFNIVLPSIFPSVKLAQAVMLLTSIRKVPVSNLDQDPH
jgi:hypothetical protein